MSTLEQAISSPSRLRMTEEQYVAWAFKQPFETEWVDGEVIFMPPISGDHDQLVWWLRNLVQFYVQRKDLGAVHGEKFQVRLPRPSRREPDILFVSKAKLGNLYPTYFDGPPDLIIEVVSPESESRDWRVKYMEYESGGVREYWVANPMSQNIEAFVLVEGKYQPIEEQQGRLNSTALEGWYVKPVWLWQQPRMDVLKALDELGVR